MYDNLFVMLSDWSESYASQAEIWKYLKSVCAKYNINRHLRSNTQVLSNTWDESKRKWAIKYYNKKTSESSTLYFDMM
jgi:cation diffusion facilitator CzcD-associated flavoprotein CzcO